MAYIKREQVLELVANIMQDCKVEHKHRALNRNIKQLPTADVQEVKHERWIPYYEEVEVYNSGGFKEKKQTGWICGKCKSKKSFTPYETENYCSNCGAKMDG